ncbi:proline-rich membrane anchor 1 isoform X5 [Vulpes lagopus]|uniref:proline-rich membrane anchor 1 isoform X5 n=1 Tax=Vulpes lagopus TaxID=494514 RepID=UPI001BC9567A|nr:proline-rich membrane anchor 1 isoform X5 [Vulpes lagopus]
MQGPRACGREPFAPGALVPRAEMLLRDLVLRRGCCWPSLLLHCALHPLWGFVQVTHGEPQKSCSKVADSCPHICQCRPPPLLPPPPPPPPPPRLLSAPGAGPENSVLDDKQPHRHHAGLRAQDARQK